MEFKIIFILLISLLVISISFAHEEENLEAKSIEQTIKDNSLVYLLIASVISTIFVVYAIYIRKHPVFNKQKTMLFLGIIVPIILATFYLAAGTIYLNIISESRGPVHWHADFEIYECGDKIDMIDPEGLANRVGTSTFHEHGDDRIHIEGVVVDSDEIDLHNFFKTIGGSMTQNSMSLLTNEGIIEMKNGDLCNDLQGTLQVFVYRTVGENVKQEKLDDFTDYVLSPFSNVPPGDCIIIELDEEKEKTDHICETYRIALERGDVIGG